jgi:hypothetical protein
MPFGDIIQRGIDALQNTKVDVDSNPFNDGKVGVSIQAGKNKIEVKVGSSLLNLGTTAINGTSRRAAQNITRGGARTAASARNLGKGLLGVDATIEREGVGSVTISGGFGGPKKASIIPGLQLRDADGNLLVDANLIPIDGLRQAGGHILDIIQAEHQRRAVERAEDYANRNRRPPQPGTRSRESILNPPGAQPGTAPRGPRIQENPPPEPPPQAPRGPKIQENPPPEPPPQAPELPKQSPVQIYNTPPGTLVPGGGRQQKKPASQPFQIPKDIPKTNTRLPRKPQIGGSRPSSRASGRSSGGMVLGPGNSNNQSPPSGGKRIVRPEDMEDLSPNSPTNKPRINQPAQNNEPRTPKRMLSPQEVGLFKCLNSDGGDACYKKFNQQKPSQNSGGSGNADIELQFGDPYIGMTG